MRRKPKICKPHCWLVEDWRKAWKWISVQIMALIVVAQGLVTFVPTLKDFIPEYIWHPLMAVLALLAILGRIINQSKTA